MAKPSLAAAVAAGRPKPLRPFARPLPLFLALLLGSAVLGMAQPAFAGNPYPAVGTCAGLPQVKVKTMANTCLGVVAADLKTPRGVLPLSDEELWVTEMGSWERGRGRLSRLLWQNGRFERSTILDKLDRPHGILLGADGWVYIGEASRIIRLHPQAIQDKPEVVLANLPAGGHHPLKQMLFDAQGNLYLSMGAKTDHCENANNTAPSYPCAEAAGKNATASIWKITALRKQPQSTVYARGLRNAMGMAWSAKGELVVTENGRDSINRNDSKLSDAQLPHDEINVLKQGADYGWPYCFDNNRPNPEYSKRPAVCQNKALPALLLPAHSAPLGITLYPHNGEITALRGMFVLALHGYRDTGHRIIALGVDAQGRPFSGEQTSQEVVGNWSATATQPMGAPVEVRPSATGKIYITDDRNGAVLRLVQKP